jgi:hypothetical protein
VDDVVASIIRQALVGGGLCLLLTQWALFVRLTYFELSWQGCIVYRCPPRHPPHGVPVLATSSTAWWSGARHDIHRMMY